MRTLDVGEVGWDRDGLVPVIVQDAVTRRVLMLGYMDTEALGLTLDTGLVHFHSRSRDVLWRKGETSGNTLTVRDIAVDCDNDALLVLADPAGPTCHTGARSCWDTDDTADQGFADLEPLWATIVDRLQERPEGSYTATLASDPDRAVRKVTEEATEVLMAARDHRRGETDDLRLAEEMADLIYHVLVVAAERNVAPEAFLAVLRQRRPS